MLRSLIALHLLVNASILISGCQFSEGRYLDREVEAAELVGTWYMRSSSMDSLRFAGATGEIDPDSNFFVLDSDGTCLFNSIPLTRSNIESALVETSTQCRWELSEVGHQALRLTMADIEGGGIYHFDETAEGELVLWYWVDDPDSWKYVEYSREISGS